MNKNMKGAIAVGAATVLLLGGGGTLAVWNATATVTGGSISSGQLAISAASATGDWYHFDGSTDCADYAADTPLVANYTLVPGDDVIYCVQDLTITAQGTNLYFTADISGGAFEVLDGATDITAAVKAGSVAGLTVTGDISTDIPGTLTTSTSTDATDTPNDNEFDGLPSGETVYTINGAANAVVDFPITAHLRVTLDTTIDGTDVQGYSFTLNNGTAQVTQVVRAS